MQVEYTLSIIKPDGVKRNLISKVNSYFESNGLEIVAIKMVKITKDQAERFYAVHQNRPFFSKLVEYISSYPVVIQVLKGENAVSKNRFIMGATDPNIAEPGTIRNVLALNIEENTVHGSDSLENAKAEIKFFFSDLEILR